MNLLNVIPIDVIEPIFRHWSFVLAWCLLFTGFTLLIVQGHLIILNYKRTEKRILAKLGFIVFVFAIIFFVTWFFIGWK